MKKTMIALTAALAVILVAGTAEAKGKGGVRTGRSSPVLKKAPKGGGHMVGAHTTKKGIYVKTHYQRGSSKPN
ncbi:MAG: hypothetical protein K2Q10_06340 [Rhodospirillales bacterium]|nr:hypothetical protein [Rhodospirillales bacterium]